MSTVVLAVALGLAAGVLSGMFGVGGGILFVPTLVDRARPDAAVRPGDLARGDDSGRRRGRVAPAPYGQRSLAGGARDRRGLRGRGRGRGRCRDALPEDVLRRLFGVLLLLVAAQLVWSRFRRPPRGAA